MKVLLIVLSVLSSSSFAKVVHKQNVKWTLNKVLGHKVTCKDRRAVGYYNGGRLIVIRNGVPHYLPSISLASDQQFEYCSDFKRVGLWTLEGAYTIEVDDICSVGGKFRRTLLEYRVKVKENGMSFMGRSVLSRVQLPSGGC